MPASRAATGKPGICDSVKASNCVELNAVSCEALSLPKTVLDKPLTVAVESAVISASSSFCSCAVASPLI